MINSGKDAMKMAVWFGIGCLSGLGAWQFTGDILKLTKMKHPDVVSSAGRLSLQAYAAIGVANSMLNHTEYWVRDILYSEVEDDTDE